jgi:hypothetical protein
LRRFHASRRGSEGGLVIGRVKRAPKLTCGLVLLVAMFAMLPAAADGAAPVLKSVGEDSRHLTASWTPALDAPLIEVATSPATEMGSMYFAEANTVVSQPLDDGQTSFTSAQALSPDTYYVHVSGIDESCLQCGTQFSSIVSIRIGSSGSKPAPKPGLGKLLRSLRVPSSQDVDKLFVRAVMAKSGTLSAAGTVSVSGAAKVYRFKAVSRPAKPGVAVKLRLRLAKKALEAVKQAIKGGARIRAKLKVTARDKSGNKQSERRTVTLKR